MDENNQGQTNQLGNQAQSVTVNAPTPVEDIGIDEEYYEPLVSWRASEFIHHQKSTNWFLPLAGAAVVLAVAMYFIGGGIIGSVMVITGAVAFGLAAGQEPKTLEYMLFPRSIAVGNKEYSYDDFKAFSVAQNGRLFSVILDPVKRFLPPVTIYFPEESGEKIFDILSAHLPTIEARADPVESLMRKLRF